MLQVPTQPRTATFGAEQLERLAPAERRVAEFLEAGGAEVLVMSAAAIADALGTSDATVVRAAQALGYAGLGDLRRALAARAPEPPLALRMRRTLADTPPGGILEQAVANHVSSVDDMDQRVTSELFDRTVAVLAASARIVWRGVGPSACLADYARLLCERVGRPAEAWTQLGTTFADELASLRDGDAVVVLAYGRLQPHVEVLLDHAVAMGAPVVLVTDRARASLRGRVEVSLESGRGLPGLFASHGTTLVLLEALVLGLAAADDQRALASLELLNDLRAALAGRRLDVDAR
jgi:DNA-binding MurR/RpiR family transcriptional regulator